MDRSTGTARIRFLLGNLPQLDIRRRTKTRRRNRSTSGHTNEGSKELPLAEKGNQVWRSNQTARSPHRYAKPACPNRSHYQNVMPSSAHGRDGANRSGRRLTAHEAISGPRVMAPRPNRRALIDTRPMTPNRHRRTRPGRREPRRRAPQTRRSPHRRAQPTPAHVLRHVTSPSVCQATVGTRATEREPSSTR